MVAILAIVTEILQAVLEILGIASVLQSGTSAIENFLGIHTGGVTLQQIYDQAHLANVNTLFVSDVGTISLLDIHNQIAALSAQVAAYSPAATSVQIPAAPPAGYGGATSSATATAVWSYAKFSWERPAWQWLTAAGFNAVVNQNGLVGKPVSGKQYYLLVANWSDDTNANPHLNSAPDLNISTILPTDASVFAWVTREYSAYSWFDDSFGAPAVADDTGNGYWVVAMTQGEFNAIKATSGTPPVVNVPPVWPGLAKATLSTSHALSDGLVITEPMDGVILELTSVAPPIQRIHYGTVEAYGHIGALSFGNDNGDQEAFQFISFANQVYCTLHNRRAASVVIKLRAGISGTATPWTVT